jgi:UDP-N-acetylmuramate dehydrogenase
MKRLSGFEEIVRPAWPMAELTWFKLGGPAEFLAEPHSVEQFADLVRRCRDEAMPVRMLGGGSNVLVRGEGVAGVVIRLDGDTFAEVRTNRPHLYAGGGAILGHVISAAVREGLGGLEHMVGVPGTVGGALHGNAGSHGTDIGQWTCRATLMTREGEIIERQRDELVFAYRQSNLDELVILEAQFALEEDDSEQLTKRMQKQWIIKKASQPMADLSAGCIFKDLRGTSAATLIEQAGLKGAKLGAAEVSQQHANFIIAHEGSTSHDVVALIDLVRDEVTRRLGVELELEIEIW